MFTQSAGEPEAPVSSSYAADQRSESADSEQSQADSESQAESQAASDSESESDSHRSDSDDSESDGLRLPPGPGRLGDESDRVGVSDSESSLAA